MFDNNKLGEIRSNQLITTFGPGSIVDAVKDSVTVLDLNYWKEKGKKIIDGRLASYLGVDCFYMPRTSYSGDIPVVSFPYMHVCSNVKCGRIFDLRENFDLDRYLKFGVTCPECHRQAYPSRFITICENGHMDDFPWSWWVHGGNTTCKGMMRMYSTGNTSTLSSTKDKVAGFINCTYLADDAEFDTSENIADNKKEFYEISLIENYRPFIFLDDAEKRTEYYSESDRNKLSGFLFRINLNDKYFWVYQHIYSVSRIDRSKNVIALFVGDTYDEIDSDIVQIDSRADVIIFSSSVVTAKMDLMQRFFGFEQYIRAGAQKTIEIIRDLDIVDSLEKFVAFENKSKLTNAKKLLKAKNSPVLQMKKNDLLENLKKHSRYKTMFKFEEDHIVISSQKEAAAFIKMLNDDIVRSELTGKEYDSSSKMLLGPVGASH